MAILFNETSSDLITLLLLGLTVAYLHFKHVYSYWKRMGVIYIAPTFPIGNFGPTIMQKKSGGELVADFYKETDEPFIGIFAAFRPMLVVRDPKILQSIFIKDFQHFVDRGVYIDEKHDPLSGHLFALRGEKWKNLRMKMSPLFTSGKLKAIFSTLLDCGQPLQKYVIKMASQNKVVEVRDLLGRFTTDIIASVGFGVEVNTIDNPEAAFRRFGRKATEMSLKNGLRAFTMLIYPQLQKLLKFKFTDDDLDDFIINLVKDTLSYREKNNVSRKDLMQLMIQLRNTGQVKNDGDWETEITKDENKKTLTLNQRAAQAWVFFLAGSETSSTTMSFCLFELAKNQDFQRKVQEEIDRITAKNNGELSYDAINEMKYLEWCIDETLRKYPPAPIINRECTQTYKVPGSNYTMQKGTAVLVPTLGLHRDPKYYPEPEKFIPERFSPENVKNFEEMPYIPFGEGPRSCIAARLGKMMTKVGLILMLQNSNYHLAENMRDELKISPKTIVFAPEGGVNLEVSPRVVS